jgi:serine/threonine protein phosphatase PrpC
MTEKNFQIESAAVTDKGLSKKRPQNEDSYLEMNECGLFAVADGVGGAQAGDVASKMAVEILSEAFVNLREGGDVEELMKIAIERANQAIYQMSHDLAQLSTMATTVVALHIAGNIATIGHVGDSRLYRLDAGGNLARETQDHSVVEEEVQAGRMTQAQAANHPNRNIISRALGAYPVVEVDMKTIMFEPNTTFLLCSDGITRHIDDTEIRELLTSGSAPANVVQKMKEICYQRGAEDNLTAVVAKIPVAVARNSVVKSNKIKADFEEQTVATARPIEIADTVSIENSPAEDFTTKELKIPAIENIQSTKVVESHTVPLLSEAAPPVNEPLVVQTGANERIEITPVQEIKVKDETKSFRVRDEGSSKTLGKILSSLLLLILGGLLGAGLYHLFLRNNQPNEPQPQQAQSSDNPLTSFEEARRTVDNNPELYIFNSVANAKTAEDFYLLGRANLLSGKFPEAKNMFLQAKERLGQITDTSSKVLGNDIETSLVMVNVPSAQEAFVKALNSNKTNANTQANSNLQTNNVNFGTNQTVNSANSNSQIR